MVSSNYTWTTYNRKKCYFIDDVKALHILIDIGSSIIPYGNNMLWDIDVTLQAQGALYFWGVYDKSPSGWKFTGVLREWGRVYYQTLKPKAAFIFFVYK